MPSLRLAALFTACSTLTLAAGCSKKVPECNSITGIINPAADKLNAAKKAKGPDEEKAMKDAKATLEGVDASLGKLEITVPELKKFVADYRAMASDIAKAIGHLEQISAAVDTQGKAVEAAGKKLTDASEKTQKAVTAHGAEDAAAMKAWSDAYAKFPKEADDKSVPDVLAALEKIEWRNAELKASTAAEIAAHREMHKTLLAMKETVKKAEAVGADVDKATAKETPLVDGLNKFCTAG